jgi:penicillin amidase
VAEALALQEDTLSLRAEALRPLLDALPALPAEAALLRGWDARMGVDSEAAALFALWWAELGPAVRLAMVPAPLRDALPVLHPHVTIALLLGTEQGLGEARLPLAAAALDRAAARWRALRADGRRWGDLHRIDLRHGLLPEANVTGARSGGDGATVMARWWASAAAPQVSGGASFRAVIDLGNWEAARGINLPGQSGDPRSPHYADLYPLWAAGETIPLAFSEAAFRAVAESAVTLEPATK